MESVDKPREEGEAKLYEYIKSLKKCREEREAKLQIELKDLLDAKFTSFQDMIQKKKQSVNNLGKQVWGIGD